jgi:hypothetical protein
MAGINPNILGANSNIGEVVSSATDALLKNTDAVSFPALESNATNSFEAVVDGAGPGAIPLKGTDSIFNPFYVFRYAKYGAIDGKTYDEKYHKDISTANLGNILQSVQTKDNLTLIADGKKAVENPTAAQILRWAEENGDNVNETTIGPTPYQWNDFLWCKWYGKIPNNRLLTLRRYPIPVEDNVQVANSKMPLIPIAQAVTWWGAETGNNLSSILGMDYGFNWKPITAKVQDVEGNEITAETLLDTAGVTQDSVRKILLATLFDNPANPYDATGFDQKAQEWLKSAYGNEGPYWNRVLGPVNVIDSTQIRDRGYKFTHSIRLQFTYKLRGFNNINPKIAMLDLITNFLSLTYNNAEFWGGSIRYFQKTGFIIPGLPSQKFEEGDFIGGIQDVIKYTMSEIQTKAGDLAKLAESVGKGISEADAGKVAEDLAKSTAAQNAAGGWIKDLMAKPLSIRSFLDGRAVGEWHLTVGNPMNPVAVIGNLCLKSTSIKFSDALGLDDFPSEVTFTVTLEPGRPRAKQDIESMFNLGGGPLTFSPLPAPSSAFNSYGEKNSIIAKNFRDGTSDNAAPNALDKYTQNLPSASQVVNISGTGENSREISLSEANEYARYFRANVRRAYGEKFSQSPSLADYFVNLKTKD